MLKAQRSWWASSGFNGDNLTFIKEACELTVHSVPVEQFQSHGVSVVMWHHIDALVA